LAVILCFSGCTDMEDMLTFRISDKTMLTIQSSSPLTLPFEVATPEITTNSSQEFQNHHTNAELVRDVRLKEVVLTITDPTDKSFSFLKAIHIYISTDDLKEIELAFLEDINSTSNRIELAPVEHKLDKYIRSSSYKLRTEVLTRETLSHDVTVATDITYQVTADSL